MKKKKMAVLFLITAMLLSLLSVCAAAKQDSTKGELPARYDLRELGLVTPVRSQDGYGLCWAFAVTAAMESNALVRGYGEYDLSEYQIGYIITHKLARPDSPIYGEGLRLTSRWTEDPYAASQCGTYSSNLMRGYAIMTEERHPFGNVEKGLYDDGVSTEGDLYVDSCYTVPVCDRDAVKGLIMKNGAVHILVNASSWTDFDFVCNKNTGAAYRTNRTKNYLDVDHSVVIVGWDDNYSRENFPTKPPYDGAWIIKNSWGTDFGDEGYIYLSYYDAFLRQPDSDISFMDNGVMNTFKARSFGRYCLYASSITVCKDRPYDRIYQYDGGTGSQEINNVKSVAMNFKAEAKELITGVRIKPYSPQATEAFEGAKATVKVYKGVFNKEAEAGGELIYSQDYNIEYLDYQTIIFDEAIELIKGEEYYVRVDFDRLIPYAVDGYFDFGYTSSEAHGSQGQTYLKIKDSRSNVDWYDTCAAIPSFSGTILDTNACIKVLTKNAPKTPLELFIIGYNNLLGVEKTCMLLAIASLVGVIIFAKKH
ncbi:MAG: hypothetical protein IJT81_07725 [Lachnospiraceae bacterium]|nr:hypothetical protein [Lachnospiraceae bacterium]